MTIKEYNAIYEKEWLEKYEKARAYFKKHGNLEVHHNFKTKNGYEYDSEGFALGAWLYTQRTKYFLGKLSEKQIALLNELNYNFELSNDLKWEKYYSLAKKYFETYHNISIPIDFKTNDGVNYNPDGFRLGVWLSTQRDALKKGALSERRVILLMDLKIQEWEMPSWLKYYDLAKSYYEHHRHLNIHQKFKTKNGYDYDADGLLLGRWLSSQREYYNKGILSDQRINKLNEIGMIYDPLEARWQNRYLLAKSFYDKYGHLSVPLRFKTLDGITYDADGIDLSAWIHNQKNFFKKGKLSSKRIDLLNDIKILWNVRKNRQDIDALCQGYNIDYDLNKEIIEFMPYQEFVAKVNYLIANNLSVTCEGKLHPIFSLSNQNLQLAYNITLEELIKTYTMQPTR